MQAIETTSAPANGGAFRVANMGAGEASFDLTTQWLSRPADQRFLSLNEMRDAKRAEFENSTTLVTENRKIEVLAPEPETKADTHVMTFGLPDGNEVASSHWCFGQLAGLAKAPAQYLRTLPSQIASNALNWGLRHNRTVEQIKAYYTQGDGGMMRAVTGPDYGRIPDYEVIEAVMGFVGDGSKWKVPGVMDWATMIYDPDHPVTKETTTLFASDRDCFLFLVDDKNPIEVGKVANPKTGAMEPDLMFRGFYVTNSEVGKSSLKLAAFYLRAICCNRIMWGVEGFEEVTMRHSKYAPDRFLLEAKPALKSFAEGSVKRLQEGVERAKAAKVAKDDEDALAFLRDRSLSRSKAQRVLDLCESEEGRPARTVWDMAQGITRAAHDELNTDTRMELETVAKRMLDKVAA